MRPEHISVFTSMPLAIIANYKREDYKPLVVAKRRQVLYTIVGNGHIGPYQGGLDYGC